MNYEVLKEKPHVHGSSIVLCRLPDNEVTPFVTWHRNNRDGSFYWGNYHQTITDAEEDFNTRGTKHGS